MELSVEDLCGLLKRSRLVTSEQVHALYDRWVGEAKERAASTTAFVRWLVQINLLTDYQATLLSKGMVDDFFLGEYTILDRLGRGRMAGVYKAKSAAGNLVAIKVLPPSRTKIPALMARFQREARLALTFNHVNVVRSLDIGETKGLHYLVMEMLDGETVDEVLQRRKRLPPAEAVAIIHQALLGLQHLHEHGVVHRDLKPSNLMLTPSRKSGEPDTTLRRTVKILDVGLARKAEPGTPVEKVDPTEVTQEGVLLGTPDYLSPEQARDPRTIDIRSDMYSLGCVLYHLMVGHTPFPDSNILNLMIRHATETPKPVGAFLHGVPESLETLVSTMIAKQADKRFATPAHAAAAAQAVLDELKSAQAEEKPKRVPTAKALKKTGKNASLAKTAPVSKPHLPPPPVVEIELVPYEMPPPQPVAQAMQQTVQQSVFATDTIDDAVIVKRRSRPQKNWIYVSVTVGAVALVAVVGAVLTLLLRNQR